MPLLLLSLQSQIKVISSRKKTYLHASVIPEYLGYASIKAHKEYCGFSNSDVRL